MAYIEKSKTIERETPSWLFNELDSEFHFNLDPCSTDENAKCENHYTKKENGLEQNWGGYRVYCNPPYGKQISKWVRKAYESNTLVVMLLPSRTDTKWFHDYCLRYGEVRFIKGRLKFGNGIGNAPFPSMIVVFRERK